MAKINLKQIKASNESLLLNYSLSEYGFLPVLKDKFNFKKIEETKIRVFILSIIVQVAFDIVKSKDAIKYIEKYNLNCYLTKKEIVFLNEANRIDKVNETWKTECVWSLLWCLSIVDSIDNPLTLGDLNIIKRENYPFINLSSNPEVFINNPSLKLRNKTEIIEKLDLYSRLDYICDWHSINNLKISFANSAVVYERRYALLWVTSNLNWDDVSCNSIL